MAFVGRGLFRSPTFLVFSLFCICCKSDAKPIKTTNADNDASPSIALELLNGRFNPQNRDDFAAVPTKYSSRKQYLDRRTLVAFEKLATAALKDGFHVQAVSATRNFTTQKAIWDQKFSGQRPVGGKNLAATIADEKLRALEILRFSSMPGTSRHHWGTDIDLHAAEIKGPALHNSTYKTGVGKKFYDWLVANAPTFGFCQPYNGDPHARNSDAYEHGYQEERWHWSYKPLSAPYLYAYKKNIAALKPRGYAGEKAAADLYRDYVLNVNTACQ